MKYVLDENGNIKIKDGKPLVVDDNGKEFTIDAIGAQDKINELNKEAAKHRKTAAERGTLLEAFGDIDPKAAKDALATVANLSSDHKLEIENLKKTMNEAWEKKFNDQVAENNTLKGELFESRVTSKFATSKVVATTVLPPTAAAKIFSSHFKADGSAVDHNGNVIYSREKPGEMAGFEEALGIIVDTYPERDSILRSKVLPGGGTPPANRGTGDGDTGSGAGDKIRAGLADRGIISK